MSEKNVKKQKADDKSILEGLIKEASTGDLELEGTQLESTITEEDKKEARENNTSLEILTIWKQEKRTERWMKISFSVVIGLILISQICYIDIIMSKIGDQQMNFDEWTIKLFVTGVFIEIIGLVKIVAENLFPKDGNKNFMKFIEEMYSKNNKKQTLQVESDKPS